MAHCHWSALFLSMQAHINYNRVSAVTGQSEWHLWDSILLVIEIIDAQKLICPLAQYEFEGALCECLPNNKGCVLPIDAFGLLLHIGRWLVDGCYCTPAISPPY